jgi:hypothetical protein
MTDLTTASVIADADLQDDVLFPVRKTAASGLLKGSFGKIKTYLKAALKMTDFSDVDISTPPTNGQALIWNSTAGKFKPVTPGATGYTPGYDLSVPAAAGFSLLSGDATNLVLADDTDVGITVDCGTPVSGLINRLAYKTLTTKTLAWDLRVRVRGLVPNSGNGGVGITLMDSVTGKLINMLAVCETGNLLINNWNSTISFNATLLNYNYNIPINWLRVAYDGTNLLFYISTDGKKWQLLLTYGGVTWLTNRADRVGITSYTNQTASGPNFLTLHYWNLSGPGV